MVSGIVRPIALCVIRRHGNLLVFEGYDTVKKDHFYRPLGGTIEFGERSSVTAAREMVEELNTEIRNVRWLGVLENIFTVHGQPGHEIVMLYEADFVDKTMYERSPIWGQEDDGSPIKAVWKPLDDFKAGRGRLVPEGLLAILEGN
jgi:ADP-ribose pyrophosphatase YjhB (NUDIX family)